MDGNFTASHIDKAGKTDKVWLMDGQAFMANHVEYQEHLKGKPEEEPVSFIIAAATSPNGLS